MARLLGFRIGLDSDAVVEQQELNQYYYCYWFNYQPQIQLSAYNNPNYFSEKTIIGSLCDVLIYLATSSQCAHMSIKHIRTVSQCSA